MKRGAKWVAAFAALAFGSIRMTEAQDDPAAAEQTAKDIWTQGPILAAVNADAVYPDSKTYVDMPVLQPQATVLADFSSVPKDANGSYDLAALTQFLQEHFDEAGSDLENTTAVDYQEEPADFLPLVTNETIYQWGLDVNALWNFLSRVENASVAEHPGRHSLIALPKPMVIAGDRFREMYYWDSFFIVQGLLVSNMQETAQNMVTNLVSLLYDYGHVPNGARTYYINRSQPPLLSEMVAVVYEATNDTAFLETSYKALKMEHAYWTSAPLAVEVILGDQAYNLSRYWSDLYSPRPESYSEDVATAAGLDANKSKALWHNLATVAASGWDFSSRWFADGKTLASCQGSHIIPADLNAYLYQMEMNMASFAEILGQAPHKWTAAAETRLEAINALLWNATAGHWHDVIIDIIDDDYVVHGTNPQTRTYASNWIPLWCGVAPAGGTQALQATSSLIASGLIQDGGIMTSLYNTGQQWDAPNAWPNLQYFIVEGLMACSNGSGQQLARQLAQTWLESNYVGYLQNGGVMVEKYDALTPGNAGGGGEYNVQVGFGWTNGVALYFLQNYGWVPENSLAGTSLVKSDVVTSA